MSTYHTVMTFLSSRFSVRVMVGSLTFCFFFFFNDTATTEIYTLSLHDALPIWTVAVGSGTWEEAWACALERPRSEEHTSELQSRPHLVCRLLLEKKKTSTTGRLQLNQKKKN